MYKQDALRPVCFLHPTRHEAHETFVLFDDISAPEVMIDEKVKVVETAGRNPEKVIKKCKETQLKKSFGHVVTVVGAFKE